MLATVDPTRAAIQAVIVVPTRELGLQVASTLKQLGKGSPDKISVMSVVEGSQNRRQQLWATAEPPHIVVGNPRALQRIVEMGRLRLNSVSVVVVDEVDACLLGHETKQVGHLNLFLIILFCICSFPFCYRVVGPAHASVETLVEQLPVGRDGG